MPDETEIGDRIRASVHSLKSALEQAPTDDVVGWCFTAFLNADSGKLRASGLSSPARQMTFLLSLLVGTAEPANAIEFGEADWDRVKHLLEEAFSAYVYSYFPVPGQSGATRADWLSAADVALPAWIHHFNTSLLASAEQIEDRVCRYLAPFDAAIEKELGISATKAIEAAHWILDHLQEGADRLMRGRESIEELRQRILRDRLTQNRAIEELRSPEALALGAEMRASLDSLARLRFEDLRSAFPDTAAAFWRTFSVARGEGPQLTYPTDACIVDTRPLIRVTDNEAMLAEGNSLLAAILFAGESVLERSGARFSYLKARDRILEQQAAEPFLQLFGRDAHAYANVFETAEGQHEHDLVIVHPEICLVVEAKASPPAEPFRDPIRSALRLRRDFRKDTGIQSAYSQGMRLVRRLTAGESVDLYDAQGRLTLSLPPNVTTHLYCVCVTRDNFGPLATDLTLLLEREPTEPYPWAVNILDLQAIADLWQYFGWGVREFREFLDERLSVQGTVFSNDELDYVGHYVQHGSYTQALGLEPVRLFLDGSYSEVFDDVYRAQRGFGPPVQIKRTAPAVLDVRRSLTEGRPLPPEGMDIVRHELTVPRAKVGRNDPCPCGSTKKYKRCCYVADRNHGR